MDIFEIYRDKDEKEISDKMQKYEEDIQAKDKELNLKNTRIAEIESQKKKQEEDLEKLRLPKEEIKKELIKPIEELNKQSDKMIFDLQGKDKNENIDDR